MYLNFHIILTFMLFVECAWLVIVGTLRTTNTRDDCGQKYQGRHCHHQSNDDGDAASSRSQMFRLKHLVTPGTTILVVGGSAAVDVLITATMRGTEEAIVPDSKNVCVASAVFWSNHGWNKIDWTLTDFTTLSLPKESKVFPVNLKLFIFTKCIHKH